METNPYDVLGYAGFEEMYRENYSSIFGQMLGQCGNPALAEDLAQDVFLTALNNYDPEKVEGKRNPRSAFRAWLFRIALNTLIDYGRKKVNQTSGGEDFESQLERCLGESDETPEDEAERRQLVGKVTGYMGQEFSDRKLNVFVLHYVVGHSTQEIADLLSTPIGTVKVLLYRGRKQLRRLVEEEGF